MLQETISRLKSETPVYFKKLQAFGATISATGASWLLIPKNEYIPEILFQTGGYLISAGAIIALMAQLTRPNQDQNAQ